MNFEQAIHNIFESVVDDSAPKLILVRGIPGSGKSTVAQQIRKHAPNTKHYEADAFFTNSQGEYTFKSSLIKAAHNWCQSKTEKALKDGDDVIVSNTFSQIWEMQTYLDMGLKYNCNIQVYELSPEPVLQGKQKNIHSVPDDTILKMLKRWESLTDEIVEKYNITLM